MVEHVLIPVHVYTYSVIAQPRSGLLQAAVVTLYTSFLLYSALSNEPYGPERSEVYIFFAMLRLTDGRLLTQTVI